MQEKKGISDIFLLLYAIDYLYSWVGELWVKFHRILFNSEYLK